MAGKTGGKGKGKGTGFTGGKRPCKARTESYATYIKQMFLRFKNPLYISLVLVLLACATHVACKEKGDVEERKMNRKINEEARKLMPFRPETYTTKNGAPLPLGDPLPRLTQADLELKENIEFKRRTRPFILTDALVGWPAMEKWRLPTKDEDTSTVIDHYLAKLFGDKVTDYYPYNMLTPGTHPYLYHFGPGIEDVLNPPGNFNEKNQPFQCDEGCRYIHLQLTPSMWEKFVELGDMPEGRHKHTLGGDAWWTKQCMPEQELQDEYHIKTHWKIILIGTQGSGMFNHSDSLMTSSWHGHVQGRKWWYVCGTQKGEGHRCYESVLQEGELLYYGAGWHHHTQCLDTPTMTLTSTTVVRSNFEGVARALYSECTKSAMGFGFSGPLCDALDKCYQTWHSAFKGKKAHDRWMRPWREVAKASMVQKKDKVRPQDNHYDGSNWIGGKERLKHKSEL